MKSHRERNQIRGYGTKTSKCSSQHHHFHCQWSRNDMAHFHSCCHSGCHHSSKRDASSSSVISVSKEPNIITESRLIGHQGLFNHEVKSIDIERLFGEQWNIETSKAQEKKKDTSHPCSSSLVPFSFSISDCMAGNTKTLVLLEDKPDKATKTHDKVGDKEKNNIQGLADTLEEKTQQVLPELSSEILKNTCLTDRSSHIKDVAKTKYVTSVKNREPLISTANNTSDKNTKETVSSLEQTPMNQGWPGLHTETHSLSPVKPPSSNKIDLGRRDPHRSVSQFVCVAAAGLCRSLKFPFLKKRSLVEESRQVLLNALQQRHGAQFRENILQGRSFLSFDSNVTKGSQKQEETTIGQAEGKRKESK